MKINILLIAYFGLSAHLIGQTNLVPNPSFEDTIACPFNGNLSNLQNWINPTNGTADCFHSCAVGNFGVPMNAYGNQTARTGLAYIGIITIVGSNSREYIQVPLLDTLQIGVEYCLNFFVCLTDSSSYSIRDIGACFSPMQISSNNWQPLTCNPQVVNSVSNPLVLKNIWIEVVGSFVAAGGERFLTIGVFSDDNNVDSSLQVGAPWAEGYYFIDDVSLMSCDSLNSTTSWDSSYASFNISPNPCTGQLVVESFTNPALSNFAVYSMEGISTNLVPTFSSSGYIIDLSHFAGGVYILQFDSSNSKHYSKIILQKTK